MTNRTARHHGAPPIHPWAFTAFAVASFGGPLALAAQGAPGLAAGAGDSSGLAMLAGAVVFTVPLAIWLRYSRILNGSGGLYAFVEAAAGRRVALAQAAIWTFSYLLYVVYTTVQIVYDTLPATFPGVGRYQTVLALAIPAALVAVMLAGRATAFLVLGVIAVGQLALRTIRRGAIAVFLLTAAVILLAVAPLASEPGLLRTDLPGVSVAEQFAGAGLAKAIGVGVAVSTAGVILCEYVALTRLIHAIGRWRLRPITAVIGAVALVAAPLSLIDPEGFYSSLLEPSLVALWVSQLIVFAVYPLFAARFRQRIAPACVLAAGAGAFAVYGVITTLQQASS